MTITHSDVYTSYLTVNYIHSIERLLRVQYENKPMPMNFYWIYSKKQLLKKIGL